MFCACSSDDDTETVAPEYHAPTFYLDDARAVMYVQTSSANGRTSETGPGGNLFKLDAEGMISPVSGATFAIIKPLRKGLFVAHYNPVSGYYAYYVVELDNSAVKREVDGYMFDLIGENDAGDLIFADGTVFRRATKKFELLKTDLPAFMIESVSGNFATVRAGAVFYVLNTVTGKQYPIENCHGPLIVALDHEQVFVDDCQEDNLLTFANGERQASGVNPFDFSTRTSTGVAILDGTALTEYNAQGQPVFEAPYTIASSVSSVTNSGDYFIIKERTGISVIKRGNPEVKPILADVNVSKFSVASGVLYYLAEEKNGRPVFSRYDLESGENKILANNATSLNVHAFEE